MKNVLANAGDLGLTPLLKDPLEKELATQSSFLAWSIPMDSGAWGGKGLQPMGSQE